MYPLKFENLYYEKVWGGEDLKVFRKNVPDGNIGESWDVACHDNGVSVVANGKYKGMKLDELIELKGKKIVGDKIYLGKFPLLVKILNSNQELSVQVHPEDEYAYKHEGEMGKTEAWYVLDAKEGSSIIIGTKDCDKEKFKQAIRENKVEDYMNKIEVERGDVYYLKSGLVHSMGAGILMVEVQQNSDTTYRIYDYNRGRELHIDKALEVMNFDLEGKRAEGIKVSKDGYEKTYYCLNEHFALELYDISTKVTETSNSDRFFIFTCVSGEGLIKYKDNQYDNNEEESSIEMRLGDSIFIPANLGKYEIVGDLKVLKSYVPSLEEIEQEILENIY